MKVIVYGRKKSKYNAEKTGDGFPSKLEASVYNILHLREKAGEVIDIKRQDTVNLFGKIRWKVDFSFIEVRSGERVWAEAKGVWTKDGRQKYQMWKDGLGPGRLEIWQGNYRNPILSEVVIPKALQGGAVSNLMLSEAVMHRQSDEVVELRREVDSLRQKLKEAHELSQKLTEIGMRERSRVEELIREISRMSKGS